MKMNFPISHIDLSKITFLLIDDNQFIRKLLAEIILCFGARKILEAENVAQALSQVECGSPDIILCDWMMSPVDGLSFLRNLRSRGIRTPIILVTGHATADYVQAALGEGADSYIVKPFSAATIMEHLLKVIAASERRATVEI
jgi:two-component system chemotaxis response regulator CheY